MADIVLDSNVVIYFCDPRHETLRNWLKKYKLVISTIGQVELLGYHEITRMEKDLATAFFSKCRLVKIDQSIIQLAIELRQQKKMSLGDAIIAAMALDEQLPLITANTKDFEHIEKLELIDPLSI